MFELRKNSTQLRTLDDNFRPQTRWWITYQLSIQLFFMVSSDASAWNRDFLYCCYGTELKNLHESRQHKLSEHCKQKLLIFSILCSPCWYIMRIKSVNRSTFKSFVSFYDHIRVRHRVLRVLLYVSIRDMEQAKIINVCWRRSNQVLFWCNTLIVACYM